MNRTRLGSDLKKSHISIWYVSDSLRKNSSVEQTNHFVSRAYLWSGAIPEVPDVPILCWCGETWFSNMRAVRSCSKLPKTAIVELQGRTDEEKKALTQ